MPFDRFASFAGGSAESRRDGVSRRTFLKASAAAGGGLLVSVTMPKAIGDAEAADADAFAPDAFIRIDRSGQVTLIIPQVEMGQGTYTSMPMLIAEELEVELEQVRVEHAPPDDRLFGNPSPWFSGDRRFDLGARLLGAAPHGRRRGAQHAGDGGGGRLASERRVPAARRTARSSMRRPGAELAYGALVDKAATLPTPTRSR